MMLDTVTLERRIKLLFKFLICLLLNETQISPSTSLKETTDDLTLTVKK